MKAAATYSVRRRSISLPTILQSVATGHASHGWTSGQADRFAELCAAAGFHDVTVSSHHSARGVLLAVLAGPGPDVK